MTDYTITQPDLTADRGDCSQTRAHDHVWRKASADGPDLVIAVPVSVSGVVILSEAAVAAVLAEAGFERES